VWLQGSPKKVGHPGETAESGRVGVLEEALETEMKNPVTAAPLSLTLPPLHLAQCQGHSQTPHWSCPGQRAADGGRSWTGQRSRGGRQGRGGSPVGSWEAGGDTGNTQVEDPVFWAVHTCTCSIVPAALGVLLGEVKD
jgi:hypothetical protein